MKYSRYALIACLFAAFATAQNVTLIHARGKPRTEPSGYLVKGGSRYGPDKVNLQADFTIDNPDQLRPGSRFDFELTITNKDKGPVVIPQSSDWSDVDMASSSQKYLSASVGISVCCVGELEGDLTDLVVLYRSDERPSTELVLMPGDSLQILGSAMLPISMSINDHRIGKAVLRGRFALSSEAYRRTPMPQRLDGYTLEDHRLVLATASEEYPIDLNSRP
jgi:hypothetical protein